MLRKLTPTEEGQPVEFKLPDLTATDWQAYLILGTLVLLFALEAPAAAGSSDHGSIGSPILLTWVPG